MPDKPDYSPPASGRKYLRGITVWGWIVLVGALLGNVVSIYSSIFGDTPLWLPTTLTIAALLIVPFIAFHKMRVSLEKRWYEAACRVEELEELHPQLFLFFDPSDEFYMNQWEARVEVMSDAKHQPVSNVKVIVESLKDMETGRILWVSQLAKQLPVLQAGEMYGFQLLRVDDRKNMVLASAMMEADKLYTGRITVRGNEARYCSYSLLVDGRGETLDVQIHPLLPSPQVPSDSSEFVEQLKSTRC